MKSDCFHALLDGLDEHEHHGKNETRGDTHPKTLTAKRGKSETFSSVSKAKNTSPKLDSTLAEAYRHAVYDDLQPLHYLPYRPIPTWGKKDLVEQLRGTLRLSRELRAAFSVLSDLRAEHPDDCEIAAVMVSFSESAARKLIKKSSDKDPSEKKRSTAGEYELLVNKRMRDRKVPAAWFGVIGYERNPRRVDFLTNPYSGLHAHCIIAYDQADRDSLKEIFAMDKSPARNSMSWVTEFEGGPVNVGAADYLSKHFHQDCPFMNAGRNRVYVPNPISSEARKNYEQRRDLFMMVEKDKAQYAHMPFRSILFLHQHFPDLFRAS
ncbi:MAG: hypothetical protein ACQEUN_16295 [Pseudomonadota bacterium]